MNVAIIGSGLRAQSIADELKHRGTRADWHSRSTGLDVTAADDRPNSVR